MSLSNKIQNYQRSEWYPFKGNIELVSNSKVKIIPDIKQKDIYILIDEKAINEDFIRPIAEQNCNPSNLFELQIEKGAQVEMHYKQLTHSFKLDIANEKNFYIDQEKEQIVFLDKDVSRSPNDPCDAWVFIAKPAAGCCHNKHHPHNIYGWADCNSPLHDSHCCKGLVEEVKGLHDDL